MITGQEVKIILRIGGGTIGEIIVFNPEMKNIKYDIDTDVIMEGFEKLLREGKLYSTFPLSESSYVDLTVVSKDEPNST